MKLQKNINILLVFFLGALISSCGVQKERYERLADKVGIEPVTVQATDMLTSKDLREFEENWEREDYYLLLTHREKGFEIRIRNPYSTQVTKELDPQVKFLGQYKGIDFKPSQEREITRSQGVKNMLLKKTREVLREKELYHELNEDE